MKGNQDVLRLLNEALTAELTSINQHYVHAKMCGNWGLSALADHHRGVSIREMKNADALIERILLLNGTPNLQRYDALNIGEKAPEQIASDLSRERKIQVHLNSAIAICVTQADNGSRELLEGLLVGHELHLDWLETQEHLLAMLGEQAYLAERM